MRRKRRHPRDRGMSRFTAGLIAVGLIAVATFFAFTKNNPFSAPYKLTAVFETANNLKPNSPVRIAGVEVGKVKKVEPLTGRNNGAARVEMEVLEPGLPIHEDAELKIRPRVFLEGNFFVDIQPGSPSAPTIPDGGKPIPINQTAAPVQLGDVLSALRSDTRSDLQVFLKEYSQGLSGKGARGFNESLRYGESAFRNLSLANDATLGQEPSRDLQRLMKGQAKTFAALVRDENALKDLVTNFNTFAGSLAREDVALEASIPALRDVLRVGSPALQSLNASLPDLRQFSVDALPGVRSSGPTLRASLPFIRQARLLVGPDELQAAARQLRLQIPRLTRFNRRSVGLFAQGRALSACTNNVLVPFVNLPFDDPDYADNTGTVLQKLQRGLVGLSGESRQSDANQSYFHTSAAPLAPQVRPAPPTTFGQVLPPRRPDVPCETQELPDLQAPAANVAPDGTLTPRADGEPPVSAKPSPAVATAAFEEVRDSVTDFIDGIIARRARLLSRGGGSDPEAGR
ncbi:MAG TPA: MlaD family protein [Thermoleophilaceae bacterium]|nr:MlaD family protein [Thermoleophilaceae bacterium]